MSSRAGHIEVVFFDLGFTLINFEGDFHKAMGESYHVLAKALIHLGCQVDEHKFSQKYHEIISNYYHLRETDLIERPVEESLNKTLDFFGLDKLPQNLLEQAITEMFLFTESFWKVEADTHAVLKQLKSRGYRLGIISNASNSPDINRLIDTHDLRQYFESILISAEEKIRKPDVQIFKRALARMETTPDKAIMVGDTLTADIFGAQKAGMHAVWITRRAERPENHAHLGTIKPDYTISELYPLIQILEEI